MSPGPSPQGSEQYRSCHKHWRGGNESKVVERFAAAALRLGKPRVRGESSKIWVVPCLGLSDDRQEASLTQYGPGGR